ncbi:MAG: hypothetical protein NLN65_02385 [Candidatus Poseidoniaceae archaeon]|nr:hypothetical protein [Candidatus Poseidoniaceae archaeon]
MSLDGVNLDRGFFHFTVPYHWVNWIGWVIGLLMVIGGIITFIDGGGIVAAIGFFVIALVSPASLETDLHNVRKNAPQPDDLEEDALKNGYEMESWFFGRSSYSPTNDPSDWILPAPGPSTWNKEDRYAQDGDGSALPEHPTKVGTPIPATFATFGVSMILFIITLAISIGMLVVDEQKQIDDGTLTADAASFTYAPLLMTIIGAIWLIVGFFQHKRQQQMIDTPTSLVRSVSVGSAELVGQIRPAPEQWINVVVDGNPRRMIPGCVDFRWEYEVYVCRQETSTDSEGNTTTKEVCNWRSIRSDHGHVPFMLHDGTGAIRVESGTFKKKNFGNFVKQWTSNHADTLRDHFKTEFAARLFSDGDVRKHRWTAFALRIGNPIYLLGMVKPRSRDELASEGLDGSIGHTAISVHGENSPGMKANLQRGTELANLGTIRSSAELLLMPIVCFLCGISMYSLL